MAKQKRLEDATQKAICHWLQIQENLGKLTYYAIPNGGWRSKTEAAIMKGLGTRAGMPDLCVVMDGYHLYIEVKSPTGRVRDNQKEAMARLGEHGCTSMIASDLDTVMAVINPIINWKKNEPSNSFDTAAPDADQRTPGFTNGNGRC